MFHLKKKKSYVVYNMVKREKRENKNEALFIKRHVNFY
jgi:hypothetical protein